MKDEFPILAEGMTVERLRPIEFVQAGFTLVKLVGDSPITRLHFPAGSQGHAMHVRGTVGAMGSSEIGLSQVDDKDEVIYTIVAMMKAGVKFFHANDNSTVSRILTEAEKLATTS